MRTFPSTPLVIAANRDEFLSRPTRPPGLIDAAAGIFGGSDVVHGGTWLGINRYRVAAALLNRRSDSIPDPNRRSRGLLCLDALRNSTAIDAIQRIAGQHGQDYNPFNLLIADRRGAFVATNHSGQVHVCELPSGLHLLTNLDLNDPTCPRIAGSYRLFATLLEPGSPSPPGAEFAARLREILAKHDMALDPRAGPFGESLCLHADSYGTRSSTLLFLDDSGTWIYLHADAPPCREAYRPVELPTALRTRNAA